MGAQSAVAGLLFGTLIVFAGLVAALDGPVGFTLLNVLGAAFVGGCVARQTPGPGDTYARDLVGVVSFGAVVTAAETLGFGWLARERTPPLEVGTHAVAVYLLGAALLPMMALLVERIDGVVRPSLTAPRSPAPALAGLVVAAAPVLVGVLGAERGALGVFFALMLFTPLFLGLRGCDLPRAAAALLLQGVVALLVALVAGKVGAPTLAEGAWQTALVLPVLAPMVAGAPRRQWPPRRRGWAELAGTLCASVALTAVVAGPLAVVALGGPAAWTGAVAAVGLAASVGTLACSRWYAA